MAANILLRPDNRFLDASIADISTYGAQPDTLVTIRPLPAGQPIEQPASSDSTASGGSAPMSAFSASDVQGAQVAPLDGDSHAASPTAHSDFIPDAHPQSAPADILTPAALGSGTPFSQLLHAQQPVPQGHTADASASSAATGATLQAAIDPIGAHVLDATHAVTGLADATTAFVVDTVGTATETLSAAVGTVTAPVATVTSAVETVVDPVAHSVDTVADAVITGVVSPVVETAAAGVTEALGAASAVIPTDDLAGLSGTDPAAGVTTLVDMVATDNLFDLRDAGAPEDTAPAASSIDQLVGDVAEVSPLLGDAAHHDDISGVASDLGAHHDLGI